ncbi:MAG: hypothetical protein K8T90_02880 [Planctomycetes bacterium]|nr:hypothetical protein [Planctomycetota bacterium]
MRQVTSSPRAMRFAARVLVGLIAACTAACGDDDTPFAREISLLRDADVEKRLAAARALGDPLATGAPVIDALAAALADPQRPELRAVCADALGSKGAGAAAAIDTLVAATTDADPFVRAFAAAALGRVPAPSEERALAAEQACERLVVQSMREILAPRERLARDGPGAKSANALVGTSWQKTIIGDAVHERIAFRAEGPIRYAHRVIQERYALSSPTRYTLRTTTWDADATVLRIGDERYTWIAPSRDALWFPALVPSGERTWRWLDDRPGRDGRGDFEFRFEPEIAKDSVSGTCRVVAKPSGAAAFEATMTYRVAEANGRTTLTVGADREDGPSRSGPYDVRMAADFRAATELGWERRSDPATHFVRNLARHGLEGVLRGPHGIAATVAALRCDEQAVGNAALSFVRERGKEAAAAAPALVDYVIRTGPGEEALAAIGPAAVAPVTRLLSHDDAPTRARARHLLWALHNCQIDVSESVPLVVARLDAATNDREIDDLLALLGGLGPVAVDAVPALVARIDARRDRVHFDAVIDALGKIGLAAKGAVPALLRLLSDGPRVDYPHFRAAIAIRAIEPSNGAIVPALAAGIVDARAAFWTRAIPVAPEFIADERIVSALVAAAHDGDAGRRKEALGVLARTHVAGAEVDRAFVSAMADANPLVRLAGALGAAERGTASAAESAALTLESLLDSKDEWTRRDAARRLPTLGAAAKPALRTLDRVAKDDPDERVRRAAAEAAAAIRNQ